MEDNRDFNNQGFNYKTKQYNKNMPRRGGHNEDFVAKNDGPRLKDSRRVTFKPSHLQNVGGINSRLAELAIRTRLEEDEDMGDLAGHNAKMEFIRRRKGSPIPRGKFGSTARQSMFSNLGWYQVTVTGGQRYSKDDLIRVLNASIHPDIFIPHYWRIERNCVVFYVDDFKIAQRLQECEQKVQMSDGYRLFVGVRSGVPQVIVDVTFKEKMKLVMAKRFNSNTNALDLSKFHADPDFKDIFVGIFRPAVMNAALDIIEKNVPQLVALNLSENSITSLESMKNLERRLPNLRILYLNDNKIFSLAHLIVLRHVPLTEFSLKNNPVRNRYKEHALYISEVRRKFPKLTRLDGEDLAPQIVFDLLEPSSIPTAKASFMCDAAGLDMVRQFSLQYFSVLDSENRQPLLDAYHTNATLSVSVPPASQSGRISNFWKFNRNLLNPHTDENRRNRAIKYGRLQIVAMLSEWPKTQHDPASFTVDLTLFTPNLICFTVGGLFKELDEHQIRYFFRQWVIVPMGAGFVVRNEMVLVTSASYQQQKTFLKPTPAPTASTSAAAAAAALPFTQGGVPSLQDRLRQHQPVSNPIDQTMHPTFPIAAAPQAPDQTMHPTNQTMHPTFPIAAAPQAPDDAIKMQMIQALSAQSNMNLEWSKKCLEETNWDYNQATFAFDKLHKENKIPTEAFVK